MLFFSYIYTACATIIVENVMLEDGEPLSVTVTVNSSCPKSCPGIVSFGTKLPEADGCGE